MTDRLRIAIPLFPEFTALDAIGPHEVLQRIPTFDITFVGHTRGEVRADNGMLGLVIDGMFEDLPSPDVIVFPGGVGTRPLQSDARVLAGLAMRGVNQKVVQLSGLPGAVDGDEGHEQVVHDREDPLRRDWLVRHQHVVADQVERQRGAVLLRLLPVRRDAPDAAVLPGGARRHRARRRGHARPQGIGTLLSRTVAGSNIDRFGPRVIALAGFAIVAAATVPFALAGPHTSEWLLAVWMVIRGFGPGAVTMPVMVTGYIGLDKQQIPHSSVLTRTAQQIGGSFGTAVLAVILEGAIAAHPATPAEPFHLAFWWSVGFSAVAVLLSLWLPGAQRPPGASRDSPPPSAPIPSGPKLAAG